MHDLAPLLERHGLLVVFLCVLCEQGGLPIPAVPALLVAGALAASGTLSLPQVLLVALVASLLADTAWLYAGLRYGRRILGWMCRLSLSPDSCVSKTDALYVRFGARSLAAAKFVPGFSTLGPALAGIARTPLPQFLLWDGIGTLLWAGSAVALGYAFGGAVDRVIDTLTELGRWGALLLGGALAGYVVYRWWWRQRFLRQLRMDRIEVDELRRLQAEDRAPLVLDVRSHEVELAAGVIPGAVVLRATELRALVPPLLDARREAVVYCSCPNEASAARIALELRRHGVRRVRPLRGGIEAWVAAGYALAPAAAPGSLARLHAGAGD